MSTNKMLREIKRYADKLGLKITEVSRKRHVKLAVTRDDATTQLFVMPVSAGDYRATAQQQAALRRFAAGGDL